MPPGHGVHTPAPARLYVPPPHIAAVALVLPDTHAYPAVQLPEHMLSTAPAEPHVPAVHGPEHADDVTPAVDPKRPAGHGVQTTAPARLYFPAPHIAAVALVLPDTHAYPALQLPLHAADASADVAPYSPAGHAVHTLALALEYHPGVHATAVTLVVPVAHAYPAKHGPTHWLVIWPDTLPYRPPLHSPLQLAVVRPVELPNVPAGHGLHTPAPARLYRPALHTAAVALVDPDTHACPALQLPVHMASTSPAAPHVPAVHGPEHADDVTPAVDP